ncbi:RNA 2',3'-cyclic phosphodiesterase [Neiella sp. HB171785]|uniref:RNA 2',3'-cyclic phosphodiesterase n=1 Tax=Neiella litorisoli TaxID=2771431 RepID=A0A8J6QKJ0_9GAMM|nr:RNA 2',3'-cyclic phosphodiesterase [Neiella litorisoli]MBD1389936.1 RNA 2',3'-cyclic phosphodiesterase [Neiella litorisoli]
MSRRLFVAIAVPQSVQQQISQWQSRHAPVGSQPVAASNYHLTLAFCGDCCTATEQELCQQLDAIKAEGWQQVLDSTGWFAKPAIGYLAPSVAKAPLLTLYEAVKAAAEAAAIKLPEQSFVPHVTVFRHHRHGAHWQPPLTPLSWPVSDFRLYHSHQGDYHQLRRWPLQAGSN